ncbi:hypothetical protein [Haematobacter missouriensis]|uniref:hypothetical protein n=1 Tax=Haematobacter missouriensis TaxID=366616 RepID=UPI0012EB5C30|nr:hypothetical protein [Haematobacter missouriensis]
MQKMLPEGPFRFQLSQAAEKVLKCHAMCEKSEDQAGNIWISGWISSNGERFPLQYRPKSVFSNLLGKEAEPASRNPECTHPHIMGGNVIRDMASSQCQEG